MQFFMSYILPPLISLIFSIILTIITLKIKKANQCQEDEDKKIAKLLDKEERENQRNLIREEIKPIVDEIAEIHVSLGVINGKLSDAIKQEKNDVAAICVSYRYRLITLCRTYLRQGYITPAQFEQLEDFFQVYRAIGGNGQAEHYYNRVQELEIRADEDTPTEE